ncbi:MAG: hypothetical protein IJS94_08390 [Clostridia bacterium]|nr:hypothetical protein [Clostridia bacterium]
MADNNKNISKDIDNDFSPAALYSDDNNTFTMKIGGTFYDVTTHFSTEGKQTVLEQFKNLILEKKLCNP